MLQIIEIKKGSPYLPQVQALYESAFPANERIPMKQLLDNKIKREFWAFFEKEDAGRVAPAMRGGHREGFFGFFLFPGLQSVLPCDTLFC